MSKAEPDSFLTEIPEKKIISIISEIFKSGPIFNQKQPSNTQILPILSQKPRFLAIFGEG